MGILIRVFDQTLKQYIEKYRNLGTGKASYFSKSACEEFISLLPTKTLVQSTHEINIAGYFCAAQECADFSWHRTFSGIYPFQLHYSLTLQHGMWKRLFFNRFRFH